MTIRRFVTSILLIMLMTLPLTGQASSFLQDGTAAAQAGDHARALELFERARADGDRGPRLTFNLAVTHYHLGNYADADRLFRELLREPRWRDLARYNLGLVAVQRDAHADAQRWFRLVATEASDESLRRLAQSQLREPVAVTAPARASRSFVAVSAGFDSNVTAFPDSLIADPSGAEDSFLELLGYFDAPVGAATRGYAFGYTRRHFDLDFLDPTALGAGVAHELRFGEWQIEVGGAVGHTRVGGEALATDVALPLRARRAYGATEFHVGLQPSYHFAGSMYPEVEGSMHRLEVGLRGTEGPVRLRGVYRFEYNDRADQATNGEFFSYSPQRHRLLAEADWRLTNAFRMRAGASHERSAYRGVNRMTDVDDVFREARRNSDRTDLWLRGNYQLGPRLFATGEFRHIRNDDTFEFYEYDRNTFSLGIEFTF